MDSIAQTEILGHPLQDRLFPAFTDNHEEEIDPRSYRRGDPGQDGFEALFLGEKTQVHENGPVGVDPELGTRRCAVHGLRIGRGKRHPADGQPWEFLGKDTRGPIGVNNDSPSVFEKGPTGGKEKWIEATVVAGPPRHCQPGSRPAVSDLECGGEG